MTISNKKTTKIATMKRLIHYIYMGVGLAVFALAGCEKKDAKVFFEGGTAPVLTLSNTAPVLDPAKEKELAIGFRWTNPNYSFTTGISSHDVTYRLEIDTLGANFSSASKGVVAISNDLSKTYTVYDFNVLLSGANFMNLTPDRSYTFQARVISSLLNNSVQLVSNAVNFTAKPYSPPPAVNPPASGKLFLIGGATPGGWSNPVPANQELTKISNTKYEITIPLTGGGIILFLPINGDWGDKYGFDGNNNENIAEGDKLRRGGGDIKVPAADGTYKVVVDFQSGRFSITRQ